ncbi:REP-associated tyrosine transposase [Gracilimonas sp. Q87]|uniref:REP-associated tyrosine transposase n=1 Tax=Gracilimonas sp. Q87 TaxID=3384766 RepID=UPI003983FAA2
MGRSRYKIHKEHYPYFLTSSIVDGIPLFKNPIIVQFILDALIFLQTKREVELNAYVVMENHMHLIAKGEELAKHVKNFKAFTAHQVIASLNENNSVRTLRSLQRAKLEHKTESKYQVWQEGFHPKQLFTYEILAQKLEYVHFNPVKRGYVDDPAHWRYSFARNYMGKEGLIPVTVFGG